MDKTYKLGVLAAVGANFIWGFSFLSSHYAQQYASPPVLLAYRFILALILLLIPAAAGRVRLHLPRSRIVTLIFIGLCEPVIYFLGEQYGLKYTNSSISGLFIAMIPIVAMILAFAALGERPSVLQWVFSAVSIGGIAAVTLLTSDADGAVQPFGIAMLIMAVCSAGCYSVLNKRISGEVDVYTRTLVTHIVGAVCFTVLALAENRGDLRALIEPVRSGTFVLNIVFLALFSSVGGFLLMNYGISHAPIANVVVICNVSTVISVITGVLILGDPFSPLSGVAMAVALLGVWGVQRFSRKNADIGQE